GVPFSNEFLLEKCFFQFCHCVYILYKSNVSAPRLWINEMLSYVNSWKLPLNSRQNTIYFLLDAKRNSLRVVKQILIHKIHWLMGPIVHPTQCLNGKKLKNATNLQKI